MDVAQLLVEIKKRLTVVSKQKKDAKALADDLLPLIQQLEKGLSRAKPKIGKSEGAEYIVEDSMLGETLAEHRLSGKARPFRCPKAVYDAILEVLVDAKIPMLTSQITESVNEKLRLAVGEFQIRVALRMFMSVEPHLLVRNRARYRPKDVVTFQKSAANLWANLRKK